MILRTNRGALLLVALLGFAVGLAVSLRVDFQKSEAINLFGGSEKPAAPVPTAPAPTVALPDFSGLAQQISPSVVNISSTQTHGSMEGRQLLREVPLGAAPR